MVLDEVKISASYAQYRQCKQEQAVIVSEVDANTKPAIPLKVIRSGGYQAETHRRLQKQIEKRKRKLWRRK